MSDPLSIRARSIAGAIAIAVLVSLALQVSINLTPGQSPIEAFALTMRFFTIWTNVSAGIVMGWAAVQGKVNQRILFALATAIVIVAVVYHALLAAEHQPVGLDWWTNLMFHTLIPAAVIIWCFVYSQVPGTGWRALPLVVIFPLIYGGFALVLGAQTGFYAYFFLDLSMLGWPQLLINMVGLSALFVIVGAILLGLRRVIRRAPKGS